MGVELGAAVPIESIVFYLSLARYKYDLKKWFPASYLDVFFPVFESLDSTSESESIDLNLKKGSKNNQNLIDKEETYLSSSDEEQLSQDLKRSLSFVETENESEKKLKNTNV